jgi:hypothetical protein
MIFGAGWLKTLQGFKPSDTHRTRAHAEGDVIGMYVKRGEGPLVQRSSGGNGTIGTGQVKGWSKA